MQIVVNDSLKDAIEWTCRYVDEYKVDIDIHIDADGEVSASVTPTYRDRQDDVPEPCEVEIKALYKDYIKPYCKIDDTSNTDCGWIKPNE